MALGRLALALIGILAYRNRDKLGALLRGEGQPAGGPAGTQSQSGGILDDIATKFGAGDALRQVLDRFKAAGSGDTVDSWVKQGPSQPIRPDEVEAAIDAETLDSLSRQTGMSRDELLRRLASELPDAVDKMTPEGRLPEEGSASTGEPTLLDDVPTTRQ
jgi:uncharacterized protein YidB (DUF937 family)